jgi:fucose permease
VSSTGATIAAAASAARPGLRRARWATRVQFAALGLVGGMWGAHIPSVKTVHGLSEFSLSMVLLAGAFGAISALFIAGRVVGALGARRALVVAGWLMCVMFALILVMPGLWAVLPATFLFGCGMSVFDVSINSEGSELESLSGPIMSNLHGMFSVGAMAGAALSSALLHAGIAPSLQLGGAAAVLAGVMLLASFGMLDTHATASANDKAHFAWPRGLLLMIGLLIFTGMIAEGVMNDWCVLYLKQDLGMPQAQAALGYSAFAGAMALSRFGGDSLRARYSERSILFAGATLAAVAMAAVLLIAVPWVAMVGFAFVGAGLAPVAPILFNAATRVPGVSRAAAIASVTSIGYSGFMVGPPLIGSIAQATSLTVALSAVVLGAVCLAIGSRKVPTA